MHPTKSFLAALCAVVSQAPASAQLPAPPQLRAPQVVLDGFQIQRGTLQSLEIPQALVAGFEADVVLNGKAYRLIVRKHEIRSRDFRLLVDDGKSVRPQPTPPCATYRGIVDNHPDSDVAATIIDGHLHAFVRLDDTSAGWNIEPVHKVLPRAPRQQHVVYSSGDAKAIMGRCGVANPGVAPTTRGAPSPMGSGPIHECEIGLDADFDEYVRNGRNVVRTQYFLTKTMNSVNVIYKRDVEIEYRITAIIVRTATVYTSANYSTLLSNFRDRWRSNHSGIRRDVAHLFTGKYPTSGVVGVAWGSSICSTRRGYGLSFIRGTLGQAQTIGVVAHELGHNFGYGHCSSGDCNIMCATLGGCSGDLSRFGADARSGIIAYRNTRTCLTQKSGNEPTLSNVSPSAVTAFAGGLVTLTGTNFGSATRVRVGETILTPGTTRRVNFRVVNATTITFEAPTAEALAPHRVFVESPSGFSNTLFLDYVPTRPRKLEAPAVATRGQDFKWEFGAGPRHNWILTVSASPSTYQLLGITWLSSPILMLNGSNNEVGYGSAEVRVPNATTSGLRFYSQVVTLNPFQNKLGDNTNVTATVVR